MFSWMRSLIPHGVPSARWPSRLMLHKLDAGAEPLYHPQNSPRNWEPAHLWWVNQLNRWCFFFRKQVSLWEDRMVTSYWFLDENILPFLASVITITMNQHKFTNKLPQTTWKLTWDVRTWGYPQPFLKMIISSQGNQPNRVNTSLPWTIPCKRDRWNASNIQHFRAVLDLPLCWWLWWLMSSTVHSSRAALGTWPSPSVTKITTGCWAAL